MNKSRNRFLMLSVLLSLLFSLSACGSSAASAVQSAPEAADAATGSELATARVSASLGESGQAVVTGHNELQYSVVEEGVGGGLTELSTLLAAQVTCGVFVAEKAAQELDVPLRGVMGTTVFDADTRRVHVYLDLPGAEGDQVLELANNFRQRCPIYTTLAEANSVDFTPGEQFAGGKDDATVVSAELFRFGGANVTANGATFVIDSVPPLDGPNEELNPLDMLLGGLAACSVFSYADAVPGSEPVVNVEADFNPNGVQVLDGPNPRIQNIRILLGTSDVDPQAAEAAEGEIKERCYLYNMLEGSVQLSVSANTG